MVNTQSTYYCKTWAERRYDSDETRPSCVRCHTTGRLCEYVSAKPKRMNYPSTPPNRCSLDHARTVLYPPVVDISGTFHDRRCFHYIQARNLTQTFGRCENFLWDITILQYSHLSSVVRSSLLALSAIFEVYETRSLSAERGTIELNCLPKYATSLYTKAVQEVIRCVRVSNTSAEGDRRCALLSCLIFSWIEVMLNNFDTVQWHLESGIRFINKIATNPATIDERRDPDDIYGSLHRSFLRLRYQTTVGLKARPMIRQALAASVLMQPSISTESRLGVVRVPPISGAGLKMAQAPNASLTITLKGRHDQIASLRQVHETVETMPDSLIRQEQRQQSLTYLHIKLSKAVLSLMTEYKKDLENPNDPRYVEMIEIVEEIYGRQKKGELQRISLDFGVNNPLFFTLQVSSDSNYANQLLVA